MQHYIAVLAGKRTALNHWIYNSFEDVYLTNANVTRHFLLAALGYYPLTQCDLPKDHHDYSESCDGITLIERSEGVNASLSKNDLTIMFINRYKSANKVKVKSYSNIQIAPEALAENKPRKEKFVHKLDTMSKQELTELAMRKGFRHGEAVEFIKAGKKIKVKSASLLNKSHAPVINQKPTFLERLLFISIMSWVIYATCPYC